MAKVVDKQDLEFIINTPSVNGVEIDITRVDWDMEIAGSVNSVKLECRHGILSSTGVISANADIQEGSVHVYSKSSEVAFGKGVITVEMTIYATNEKFDKGIQVLKTFKSNTGIVIV